MTGSATAIVTLAGSAADTRGIERFLGAFPPRHEIALVVIFQHREALDEQPFTDKLTSLGWNVRAIADGARIEPGYLYLPGTDQILTVDKRHFQIRSAEQTPGERGTVDSFLVSLAREEDGGSVVVLFTLTGGDGVLGVTAIKEAGGLAAVEEGEHQRAGDLAASNSPAALADFILPAEKLAERLSQYVARQARAAKLKHVSEHDEPATAAVLTSVAGILHNKTGHDFHGYKRGTFMRRVQRRMQVAQVDSLQDYVEYLRTQQDEPLLLFNDLLIGVTQFFRDDRDFSLLESEVIPKLFDGKTRADKVRVWSIGCSTGEEAYSLAILLREHMSKLDETPQIHIFATDLDGRALATARAGRYTDAIKNDISPERLARWFVREGNTYCVVKDLREMCIFSQHSVIKDAPFSRLDLLSCRNLLIYLDAEVQNRVIPLFHFALRPGGYLFLGNSENISRYTNLFKPVESRSRIFKRLETAAGILPDFPFTTVERRVVDSGFRMARPRAVAGSLELRALRIADQHAPAYVITDQDFGVLHFSGRTGRFLEPADGAANLNLLNLVHPDLRLDLRGALARVIQQKEGVRISSVPMGRDGDRRVLDLVVEPIQDGSGPPDNFVVLFKEAGERPNGGAVDGIGDPEDNRIQRLEAELRTASGRLQATVEELETTNEELKSSNEEYQSLNEELQSANEELETSKEELQSINEELTTVNGELAHRVQELAHTNSDLKNLLESTQIATVFLDNNFRVTRFTPAVTEVFHLIETDIGRPISHIKSRLSYDELQDDVTRVLRTLSSVDREVENPVTGTRYMVRVLPYRTVDNYIHGAVLTFTDLTPVVEAQTALRESERHARLLLAELQHRVRNTLAVIRSIARRSAVTSESVKDFAKKLDGRISAFARVQTAVTRDPSAGMTLNGLITDELLAVGASIGKRVRKLAGPDVRLHPKAAETLALVVHELATNAVKYGALSIDQGEIDVNWRVQTNDGPGRFILQWREAGVTFATDKPRRRGFGTELIERTIAYDLGGAATLDFGSDGLICTIELPASNKILHQ